MKEDEGSCLPCFHYVAHMFASTTLPAHKCVPGAELCLWQKSGYEHAMAEQPWDDLLWSPDGAEMSVGLVGMLINVFIIHVHIFIHSGTWPPLSCSKL